MSSSTTSAGPSRRILALSRFGPDIGEQATLAGLAVLLGELSDTVGLELILDQSDGHDLPLRDETLATLEESYDLVLLGPGGLLGPSSRPTASGWAFDIPTELLRRVRVPFGMFSVGFDDRPRTGALPAETAAHIALTMERATFVSARDEGTRRTLATEVGSAVLPACIPDPAILTEPDAAGAVPGLDPLRPVVMLDARLDDLQDRYPKPAGESFERYVGALVDVLKTLVADHSCQVVFAPLRLEPSSAELGQLLTAVLPKGAAVLLADAVPGIYASQDLSAPGLLTGLMGLSQLVIGQHLHTSTLAAAAGTPAITISQAPAARFAHADLGFDDGLFLDLAAVQQRDFGDRLRSASRMALAERTRIAGELRTRREELIERTRRLAGDLLRPLLVDRTPEQPVRAIGG